MLGRSVCADASPKLVQAGAGRSETRLDTRARVRCVRRCGKTSSMAESDCLQQFFCVCSNILALPRAAFEPAALPTWAPRAQQHAHATASTTVESSPKSGTRDLHGPGQIRGDGLLDECVYVHDGHDQQRQRAAILVYFDPLDVAVGLPNDLRNGGGLQRGDRVTT